MRFVWGIASVTHWVKNTNPTQTCNKPATKIDMIALVREVREFPGAYQAESDRRQNVSENGIGHALRHMNIGDKKSIAAAQSGRRQTEHIFQMRIKARQAQSCVIV